jgi:hypothetical protein
VQYGGTLKLKGCTNTKKYEDAKAGRFGELQGETMCTARHCLGGLQITGTMRY